MFIVVDNDDLLDKGLTVQIADLFTEIYNAPPWNESWTRETSLGEIYEVMCKKDFVAVLARCKELVGFSWGFRVPERNTSRVDFVKIREELYSNGYDPNRAFYGADTGVRIEFRNCGVATALVKNRMQAAKDCDVVVFRTKNPVMVEIYNRLYGDLLFSFPEESAYKGGRVYVFGLK